MHLVEVATVEYVHDKVTIAIQSITAVAFSGDEQTPDLVYLEDVVEAFLLAAGRCLSGESSPKEQDTISSMAPYSLRQVADNDASVLEVNLNVNWCARPYREREVMSPWKAIALLPGWRPKISLHDGIGRSERRGIRP
jgi:nucleoside-diphosphate-sugar epimerase